MNKVKTISFEFFRWIIKLINISFISIFTIIVIVFLTELFRHLPILEHEVKYDPIAISNTFIVYVTFIVVIGTVALTLAGFYFQRSLAKREGEILNENLDKVLNAIATDENGFNEKLVDKLLEHKKIKPLIQAKLDLRVESFESELKKNKNNIDDLTKTISSLEEKVNNSPHSVSSSDIKFDIPSGKDSE